MASRAATQRAAGKAEKDRGPGITVTHNGKKYSVFAKDLTALDARAMRQEIGLSFAGLLGAAGVDMDIDLLAGVVWLSRRVNGERELTYEEVAVGFTYDGEYDVDNATADDEDADPEA